MTSLRIFFSRLRGLLHDADPRLDEELSTHLDLLTAEYERTGLQPEDARAAARRELGSGTRIREVHREQRRLSFVDSIFQDLRYTFRHWRAHPGFAATAILTLGLGIGANSAIFQLLDRIVLRSLPVRDPQHLVITQGYWNDDGQGFSYPLLREMNARQSVVEGIFASGGAPVKEIQINGRTVTETPDCSLATGNYFRLIGTTPQLGRFFTESDDAPAAPAVTVLSDRFWRSEFGGQTSAIGGTIRVNGVAVTIIGVTRPEFFGDRVGSTPALWMPMSMATPLGSPDSLTASMIWLVPMARLRADVPLAQAHAQLSVLWDQLREFSMQTSEPTKYRLELLPGRQGRNILQTQFTRPLWLLMGIVGLVALIACSNLANLLLARATARTHEMGVRLALGAGRTRLLRQLLTESFALAALGGLVGLVLASFASNQLILLASAGETWQLSTSVDWRIAMFTLLVTLASVIIFGIAPAFAATRVGLNAALHTSRRSYTGGAHRSAATRVFVIAQVSLSLLLVAGASLLVRSFWKLTHQEFGYQTESLLMVTLRNNGASFDEFLAPAFSLNVARRAKEIPGVRNAAVSASGLLNSGFGIDPGRLSVPDRALPESAVARIVPVTPGYLETMGIAVVRGRSLTDDDRRGSPHVAVISETAARLMFGSADPIGQKFSQGDSYRPNRAFEVVGVMHDVRYASPREPFGGLIFAPLGQVFLGTPPTLAVRTVGDTGSIPAALEQSIREISPEVKIVRIEALRDVVQTQARRERLLAWLSGAFGGLALLLAAVGLYGVISYAAERRTQEMGIRLALGARAQQVRALLLREVGFLLATGLVLGGAATIVLARTLRSLLFDLAPQDPATLAFAAMVLSLVALAAGYFPARRAARLDPMIALRTE